jgi:transcriptional regulator with XRE-family HTH domain
METGDRLRTLRRWCGASQRGLAKASGISLYALRRYEKGLAIPRLAELHRIAKALKASLVFLHSGALPPTEEDVAEMRLWWKLNQVSPQQAATVLQLVDGILSQIRRRVPAAAG